MSIPYGVLKILGLAGGIKLPGSITQTRSTTQTSGEDVLGSPSLTYTVPGMSSELSINFGIFKLVAGCLVLDQIISFVDEHNTPSNTSARRFSIACIGALQVFCTISSQSSVIFNYAILTGRPVHVLFVFSNKIHMKNINSEAVTV